MENPLLPPLASPDPAETDPGVLELARSLGRARGSFALFIATCNDPVWRDHCIRHLGSLIPGSLIRSCRAETQDPLDEVSHPQPAPVCIHLTSLELAVPADESNIQPLRLLNLHRARWKELACPVVLWLPEYLLGLLMRRAPDFADWRSSSLPFLPPSAWGAMRSSGVVIAKESRDSPAADLHSPSANADVRQDRIAELSTRLAAQITPNSAAANDAAQADWCEEIACLLVLSGRLDEARHFHALALAFWDSHGKEPTLALSWSKMGDACLQAGQLAAAEAAFQSAHTLYSRLAASDPANAAWQRDLSVSLEKLGDLAVAQGDLPGALRYFTESKTIAERLAASDPDNAEWQRDLAVSHFKLYQFAQKAEDEAMMQTELRACFLVLDGMKRRGMHLDPPIANLHGRLAGMFGGG